MSPRSPWSTWPINKRLKTGLDRSQSRSLLYRLAGCRDGDFASLGSCRWPKLEGLHCCGRYGPRWPIAARRTGWLDRLLRCPSAIREFAITPSSTAVANKHSCASRGRFDQTFSAACPNNLANRSSSLCGAAGEIGMSDGVDRLCGGIKSASSSEVERKPFPPAWREPSSASVPSPTISATICFAVPITVSFVFIRMPF
jgi:hypothetical protein